MNDVSHLNVDVFLDLYSGRENPRWTLSGERVEELKAKLEHLTESDPKPFPGLGYRGFVLRNVPRGGRVSADVLVFDSTISITQQDETRHYSDAHGVEEWLLSQAKELGHADTIDRLRGRSEGKPGQA